MSAMLSQQIIIDFNKAMETKSNEEASERLSKLNDRIQRMNVRRINYISAAKGQVEAEIKKPEHERDLSLDKIKKRGDNIRKALNTVKVLMPQGHMIQGQIERLNSPSLSIMK